MTGDLQVRRPLRDERQYRRGLYLLPTIFTVGNMFCGYACVIFAMRGELSIAAPFVGVAVVLDMLDGRIARLTKTSSAFGLELDSLADVISFGIAPAMLAVAWGWPCSICRPPRRATSGISSACPRRRRPGSSPRPCSPGPISSGASRVRSPP